jgi:Calcineurin-like phosphoesterase
MHRRLRLAVALATLAGALGIVANVPDGQAATATSFTFGAAGDMGVGPSAAKTLTSLGQTGTDFFLHLGDFSYGGTVPKAGNTPADWCNFVKTKSGLPANYPYELVSGGHASQATVSQDGALESYTACLPDQLHSTIAPGSEYGKDYYFDYPAGAPLARVFMIAAGETFSNGGTPDSYQAGSPNSAWLAAAIDDARSQNIPWVVVGMAFNCVTAGDKHCEITSDLFNLLVQKHVDLVLQGHEHGYERSGQFAENPTSCPGIPIAKIDGTPSYSAGCIADNGSTGNYAKGVGPVVVISGTAGIALRPMNSPGTPDAPEAPYFAKLMGGTDPDANHGFMKYTVTASQLTATFVSDNDGQAPFSDSFTITGAPGSTPPPGTGPSSPPPTGPAQPGLVKAANASG